MPVDLLDDVVEHVGVEGHAQHRGCPEERSLRGQQPVDAARDHVFDRVRKLGGGAGGLQVDGQLGQEQRVALSTLDQPGEPSRRQPGDRCREQVLGVARGEWLDREGHQPVELGESPVGLGTASDEDQPWPVMDVARQPVEEVDRDAVHELDVLEDPDRRRGVHHAEELAEGRLEQVLARRRVQLVDLDRALDLGPSDCRYQRKSRYQVWRTVEQEIAQAGPEPLGLDREEPVERVVRRTCRVEVALQAEHGRVLDPGEQLAHDPGLADARLATDVHHQALAGGRRVVGGQQRRQLPIASDKREVGLSGLDGDDRVERLRSADDRCLDRLVLAFDEKGSSGSMMKAVRHRSSAVRLATSWPGAAFAINRAARFTASPVME